MVGWVGVEDVDEEVSILDSDHCFEAFMFGSREVIMVEKRFRYNVVCRVGPINHLRRLGG